MRQNGAVSQFKMVGRSTLSALFHVFWHTFGTRGDR